MHLAIPAFLASALISTSLGGVLQVIDEDRVCKIYSNNVHGCTGYSASFAKLNGEDCSDLSVTVNGTHINFPYLDVAVCGQANGRDVAWIRVSQTEEVTFFNQNGVKANCKLDDGLRTGSSCGLPDYNSLTSSSFQMPSSSTTSETSTADSDSSSAITSDSTSTTESDSSLATTAGSATANEPDSSLATTGSATATTSDPSGRTCSA